MELHQQRNVAKQRRHILVVGDRYEMIALPVYVDVLDVGTLDALDIKVLCERIALLRGVGSRGTLGLAGELRHGLGDPHVVQVHRRQADPAIYDDRDRNEQDQPADEGYSALSMMAHDEDSLWPMASNDFSCSAGGAVHSIRRPIRSHFGPPERCRSQLNQIRVALPTR